MLTLSRRRGFKNYWCIEKNDDFLGYIQKERIPNIETIELDSALETKILNWIDEDTQHAVSEKALYLLSRSSLNENKLIFKLKNYDFNEKYINKTILQMKSYGYLNDEQLIKFAIEEFLEQKIGPMKIKEKLFQRKFNKILIETMIDKYDIFNISYTDKAIELLKRKNKCPYDKKSKEKAYRFLLSRGFDYETSNKAINSTYKENNSFD